MQSFQESEVYKKALKEYQKEIYGKILNPLHSIIIDNDEVYLFYEQNIINDIYSQMIDVYNKIKNDEEDIFPISLGYETPLLKEIIFMGVKYKAIFLWYDNCDIPNNFEAKI